MYELIIHKNLNAEKWSKFTAEQRIIMIANEVQRLLTCIGAGMTFETKRERVECVFELTDLTIGVSGGNFCRELLRWREIFGQVYLLDEKDLNSSANEISGLLRTLLQLNPKSSLLLV